MAAKSFVVVFPSVFSRRHAGALVRNIKRVLKIQNESYTRVSRDGELILVDAHDPVFASSAIGLLFGVEKVLIARQTANDFDGMVQLITEVGGNLLLRGERFLVQVEGRSQGFLPRDVEMSATSSIIEKKSALGARPGTPDSHDKLLYAYMTKRHAYVSIFADRGLGGLPHGIQGRAVSCIFDELSAVSCFEAIRMGFDVRVIACYRRGSDLMGLAKILDRMIPLLLLDTVEITFYKASPDGPGYLDMAALSTKLAVREAALHDIPYVSLPVSRMLFPGGATDELARLVSSAGRIPLVTLPADDSRLLHILGELNLSAKYPRIRSLISKKHALDQESDGGDRAPADRQVISIRTGPNNLHDMLDSLR